MGLYKSRKKCNDCKSDWEVRFCSVDGFSYIGNWNDCPKCKSKNIEDVKPIYTQLQQKKKLLWE